MSQTTYQVRLWSTRTAQGPRGRTYKVRWATGGHAHAKTFATAKLADSFRSALVTASRAGAAFDTDSGLCCAARAGRRGWPTPRPSWT